MAGHLWIISDLHIADKGPRDKFGATCEDILIRELDTLSRLDGGANLFVHNGDVFDLLKIDPGPEDGQQDQRRVDAVITAYAKLFDAWHAFVERGNQLVWIVGNHDHALVDVGLCATVSRRIQRSDISQGTGFAVVPKYYFNSEFSVYIEHGHRFDGDNYTDNGATPFGSILVEQFLNRLEDTTINGRQPFRLIDNVRPYRFLPQYVARMILEHAVPQEIAASILKDLAVVLLQHGRAWFGMAAGFLDQVLASQVIPWQIIEKLRELISGEDYSKYEQAAVRVGQRADPQVTIPGQPLHVVFGHTHYLDHATVETNPSVAYYNTGTWIENVFLRKDGYKTVVDRFCPILKFGGASKPTFTDANQRQDMDADRIREFYREYHVTMGPR